MPLLPTFGEPGKVTPMEIVLDGRDWRTEADFLEAVIAGVDGPSWHGRNYNALHDSFVTGSVNGIEPPYDFIIKPPCQLKPELAEAISYFVARISQWRAQGARVSARMA